LRQQQQKQRKEKLVGGELVCVKGEEERLKEKMK